jgi:hypothetical protein
MEPPYLELPVSGDEFHTAADIQQRYGTHATGCTFNSPYVLCFQLLEDYENDFGR